MKRTIIAFAALILLLPLGAQGAPGGTPDFSAGLNLGSDLLPTGTGGALESWSKLGFQPDLALGKFGVGLDLTFRFKLYPDAATPFELYAPDWVPSGGQTVFDVYLPKIMYVRYGLRGVDPLYAKLGSISDFSLGNGLIVSDYANTRFLPDLRLFGLQAGVDGSAFNVPYFGLEVLTGNLANLDVIGGRLYLRPLGFLGNSVPGKIQLGGTVVLDRNPYLYGLPETGTEGTDFPNRDQVMVYGADVTAPIITGGALSLTAFVEGSMEPNGAMGAIGGFRGSLLGFIKYGAQVRYLQEGFVPSYFDANYDLYRAQRFVYMTEATPGAFIPGWQASLGFDLFTQKLVFGALLDGPFALPPSSPTDNAAAYPHLKGSFVLKEGMIGGLSFEAGYEKYFIGRGGSILTDVIDPTDAVIGLSVHYKTGATVLTLDYDYMWDPNSGTFDVSSSLSAEVRF